MKPFCPSIVSGIRGVLWLRQLSLATLPSILLVAFSVRVDAAALSGSPLPRLLLPEESHQIAAQTPPLALKPPAPVRPLRLNPAALSEAKSWFQPGREVRLDLLENQDITVAVEAVQQTLDGGAVVLGRATSDSGSTITLTLQGNELTGMVSLTGLGHFRILPLDDNGRHEVRKLESRPPGFCATGFVPSAPGGFNYGMAPASVGRDATASELPPADTLPEPTIVDVLFLYTPQTVAGEGNEEGIRRKVLEAVEETNYRFTNSLINVRINPVYIGLVNYTESGDMTLDLTRLVNGSDGLQSARSLRNDYKADLVCLVTELENQGIGGYAWDLTPHKGNPDTGFTTVRRILLGRGFLVLAHEIGHLLGCAHDREHAGDVNSAYYKARRPYIFGHRFQVEGVTYTDLMTYEPGIPLPHFSNPRIQWEGAALGVEATQANPADGARTINETAPYVARYREALSRIEFTSGQFIGSEDGGSVTVRLKRTGDVNTSTRVNVLFDSTGSAQSGVDYTRPSSTSIDFATNQIAAEFVIPILPDELVEGAETIRLRLSTVQGAHGIGRQGATEVLILDAGVPEIHAALEFPDGPIAVSESAREVRVKVAVPAEHMTAPVSIPYRTEDSTATAGTDYEAVSGFISFTSGDRIREILIPVLNQPGAGPDRIFRLIAGVKTNEVRIVDEQRQGSIVGNPGATLKPDGSLNAAIRHDGKLLVWGDFARLGGMSHSGIALLNQDGTADDSFRAPDFLLGHRYIERAGNPSENASLRAVQPLPDGRFVVAGEFSRINGQARQSLARIQANGALDESFGQGLTFDGGLLAVAVQTDGRILIGGSFEHINGTRRPFIARLNSDGTVDESFKPNGGPTSDWTVIIAAIALQPDGKILIGGYFKQVDGKPLLNLARLNADGTLDSSFKLRNGASGPVWCIRLQADGRIVVGGVFDTVDGRNSRRLARLNPDGSIDSTFRPPNPNADVREVVCLPDGRLLISGYFTRVANQNRRFVALLKSDGSLDGDFNLGMGPDDRLGIPAPQYIPSSATPIHADGSLYLAGSFQRFNGLEAPNLIRLRFGDLPPRLGPVRATQGDLHTMVHGLPGGNYAVEASTDWDQWRPVGEVRLNGYDRASSLTAPATRDFQVFRLRTTTP